MRSERKERNIMSGEPERTVQDQSDGHGSLKRNKNDTTIIMEPGDRSNQSDSSSDDSGRDRSHWHSRSKSRENRASRRSRSKSRENRSFRRSRTKSRLPRDGTSSRRNSRLPRDAPSRCKSRSSRDAPSRRKSRSGSHSSHKRRNKRGTRSRTNSESRSPVQRPADFTLKSRHRRPTKRSRSTSKSSEHSGDPSPCKYRKESNEAKSTNVSAVVLEKSTAHPSAIKRNGRQSYARGGQNVAYMMRDYLSSNFPAFRSVFLCTQKGCRFAFFHDCTRCAAETIKPLLQHRDEDSTLNEYLEHRGEIVQPGGSCQCIYCSIRITHNLCLQEIKNKQNKLYFTSFTSTTESCKKCNETWSRTPCDAEYKALWKSTVRERNSPAIHAISCSFNEATKSCECGCIEIRHRCKSFSRGEKLTDSSALGRITNINKPVKKPISK